MRMWIMKYGANLEEIRAGIGCAEWIKVRIEITLTVRRDLRVGSKIGFPAAVAAVTRA